MGNKPDFISDRSKPDVRIVLPEQDAVFCTRGEHAVGLVHPFGHKVVYQHSDIGFVALQYDGLLPFQHPVCIDPGHQPLGCGLFVSGRPVDLPGEIKGGNEFRFERMVQLCGWKIVVFDGIARAIDVEVFESPDFMQCFQLYFPGQRRRKTVEVVFVGAASFGFEEELVLVFVGECTQFVFDARAVARPDSRYRPVEQRRAVEPCAQDVVHLGRRVDQKTRELVFNRLCIRGK